MYSGDDLIKSFNFIVQCKTPLDNFLSNDLIVDQLPLVKQNKLPSPQAMNVILPQPSTDNAKSTDTTPPPAAKPTQKPVLENDVYIW